MEVTRSLPSQRHSSSHVKQICVDSVGNVFWGVTINSSQWLSVQQTFLLLGLERGVFERGTGLSRDAVDKVAGLSKDTDEIVAGLSWDSGRTMSADEIASGLSRDSGRVVAGPLLDTGVRTTGHTRASASKMEVSFDSFEF